MNATNLIGRRPTQHVDAEKFVRVNCEASLEGHDTKWIAQQLGVDVSYVNQKRVNLRKLGVALPDLQRGRVGLDDTEIAELNKLAQDLIAGPKTPARGRGRNAGRSLASAG